MATRTTHWLREPLLHFVILGGALFAADRILVSRADDPNTIVVGADVDYEAIEIFKTARGRDPSSEELAVLHRRWLDNEVLYREGLALALDKGDTHIRERVIFKMLMLIGANVELPPIDDAELRAWFEQHRDKYDEPPRYDFQEAVLAGRPSEADVHAFVDRLNHGEPGDVEAGLRVFTGRPRTNLVQSYGPEFTKELEESQLGEWRAMVTREGWRAMRLDAMSEPIAADYEAARGIVLQDWREAVGAQKRTDAVRALEKKYRVVFDVDPNHETLDP